jgi:hypothetical protein
MESRTKPLDKEGIYLLQRIDCNCNNCGYMRRDLATYKVWEDWHRAREFEDFEKRKAKAITDAEAIEDEGSRKALLYKANKMRFHFEKIKLINYGYCTKFDKPVTFLPNICQIETQRCFVHRTDYVIDSLFTT